MKKKVHSKLVLNGDVIDDIFSDIRDDFHNEFEDNKLSVIGFSVGSKPANFESRMTHQVHFSAEVGLHDPDKNLIRDPNTILTHEEIRKHVGKDQILNLILPKFKAKLAAASKAKGIPLLELEFKDLCEFTKNGECINVIFYCDFGSQKSNKPILKDQVCKAS